MSDLIKALQILLKYGDPDYPTHCEHDVMYICGINVSDVSQEDINTLDDLGFFEGTENPDQFISYKFGSA